MGWVNYVIIPKHKLAFAVSRSIDENTEFECVADLFEWTEKESDDVTETEYKNMTLKQLVELVKAYEILLNCPPQDAFLVFLFKQRFENVEILSGAGGTLEEKLRNEGYVILE